MSLDDRLRRGLHAAAHDPALAPDPDADVAAGRHRVERRRRRTRLVTGVAAAVVGLAAAFTATRLGDDGDGRDGRDDPTMVGDEGGAGREGRDGRGGHEVEDGMPVPGEAPPPPDDGGPPRVRVTAGDRSLELDAVTYCYGTVCADGVPPASLPDVGAASEVQVDFALEDWTFTAELRPAGDECGRSEVVELVPDGRGRHVLRPAGPAGDYDVFLSGWGDGDVFYAFRWTTTGDGPSAAPTARLALPADHDGRVDSYGVELEVAHLATTPAAASASVTLRAADGRSHTFPLPDRAMLGCPEGHVSWTAPAQTGLDALAAVGGVGAPVEPGMYTVEVVLTLDGVEHRATARWPDDTIAGNEPSVALDFTPALPAVPSP
ncbi:MAG TPA: hypothetical protein VIL36_13735 [Acidimicrobiales bacterium]